MSPLFLKTLVDESVSKDAFEQVHRFCIRVQLDSSNWANLAAVEENHWIRPSTTGFFNREKQNEDEHMSLAQTFLHHDLMMKPGLEPR